MTDAPTGGSLSAVADLRPGDTYRLIVSGDFPGSWALVRSVEQQPDGQYTLQVTIDEQDTTAGPLPGDQLVEVQPKPAPKRRFHFTIFDGSEDEGDELSDVDVEADTPEEARALALEEFAFGGAKVVAAHEYDPSGVGMDDIPYTDDDLARNRRRRMLALIGEIETTVSGLPEHPAFDAALGSVNVAVRELRQLVQTRD